MKTAICYEIVMLVARTLNIILKIPKKLWIVFTSSGTDVGGARQYSFEFYFSPRIRTTLIIIYNIYNVYICVCVYVCAVYVHVGLPGKSIIWHAINVI